MGRKRIKPIELTVEHMVSNTKIIEAKCCSQCPLKIYANENDKIIFGIGNIYTDTIMILPSYDVQAKIGYTTLLTLLEDAYKSITGRELTEDYYITRYVKCFDKTNFDIRNQCISYCIKYLYSEYNRIKPRKIISFSKDFENWLNIIPINVINVISPGVMYYNNDKLKNIFIEQLKSAINYNDT